MPRKSDLMTLYRVSRYCYKEGLTQKQIAAIENLSRSQISRLLEKARELGIVKISLHLPSEFDASELSDAIKKGLGLEKVIVAPVTSIDNNDDLKITQTIAIAAAEYLSEAALGNKTIGIGWGRTIYETSHQLTYMNTNESPYFVPMIGMSGDDNPNLQINAIIDRFCDKFRCRGLFTNIPTIREKNLPLTKLEQERLANLKSYWNALDMAVIGLGGPPEKTQTVISEFSDEYIGKITNKGICGDILAQFFFPDGKIYDIEDSYDHVSFDIRKLKGIRSVICLAGGAEKVNGIITAAKAGFIKTLITDSITAGLIFELL
ncbi:MAG: sugar-binding domain-containing protein [Desulfitobacteriaceae bacterium]|nr:sugar-binding domain-containing protein [Desulfitobacteriaceae bacterium]